MVTTDLLARGFDFPDLSLVINYDVPLKQVTFVKKKILKQKKEKSKNSKNEELKEKQ